MFFNPPIKNIHDYLWFKIVDISDKKSKFPSCIGFCFNPNGVDNYANKSK